MMILVQLHRLKARKGCLKVSQLISKLLSVVQKGVKVVITLVFVFILQRGTACSSAR
jgi:hypothetical protein